MTVHTERKRKTRAILVAAVTALSIPALTMSALTTAAPSASAQAMMHGGAGGFHGRADHVEGRIAYLKAELKITDAQAQAWDGVAAAMRRGSEAHRALREEMRSRGDKPLTAVERLALRDKAGTVRVENAKAFTTAFTALYGQLSDEQKKAADQLLSPRRHHRA